MIFFKTVIAFIKDKDYRDLLITTLVVILIGTLGYHYIEGWSWIDSAYFSIITLTTVGYGDITPQTNAGKIFTIIYIINGIGIILAFINTLYKHYENMRDQSKKP